MLFSTDHFAPLHSRVLRGLLFVAIASCCGPQVRRGIAQDAAVTIEHHIPGDVTGAFLMDNAAETDRQFQATPMGKMLASADWQPYWSAIRAANVPSVLHLRPSFGIDWSDVSQFSVPMAIVVLSDSQGQPPVALIIDTRRNPKACETLHNSAVEYFQGRGATISTESLRKGRRTSFLMPPATAGSPSPVSLEQEGLLAFVTSEAGAEVLFRFWNQSTAPSLGQSAPYQQAIKTASGLRPSKHAIRAWLKPLPLARALNDTSENPRRSKRDWLTIAERQGVESVKAIGAVLDIKTTGAPNFEFAFSILAPAPYTKAFRMATLLPGPWLDPPTFVPDSVSSWSLVYQDVPKWFDGFGDLFDEMSDPDSPGALQDILDAAKTDPEGPQIDIEKEIFGRLVSGFVRVHDYGATKSTSHLDGSREMYVFSVREGEKLVAVFKKYFGGDDLVHSSEINGGMMWSTVDGHGLLMDTGEKRRVTITSLAVANNRLLLCTDVNWLREALKSKTAAKPLARDNRFLKVAAYFRSRQAAADSLRSFVRLDQDWQQPYQQLAKSAPNDEPDLGSQLLRLLLCSTRNREKNQVLSSLPPWTKVGPSLGTSAMLLRATSAGFEGLLGVMPDGPIAP